MDLEHWHAEMLKLKKEVEANLPKSPVEILREQLDTAISDEQFEEAAKLRDRIRLLLEEEL